MAHRGPDGDDQGGLYVMSQEKAMLYVDRRKRRGHAVHA